MAYQCWDGEPVVVPQFSGLRLPGIEPQGHDGDTYRRPYCTSCYYERSGKPFTGHYAIRSDLKGHMYDEF